MSFWKQLLNGARLVLKRKPGGTFVGNFLRKLLHKKTNGQFGNGAMMIQEGESPQQSNQRMLQGLGAAAGEFQDTALAARGDYSARPGDNVAAGLVHHEVKGFIPYILGGLALLVTVILLMKKRK